MKEFKGVDAAFNLFMSKFEDTELWLQCDKCGEKIRENISDHKCKKKHPIEGELVDLVELYCTDWDSWTADSPLGGRTYTGAEPTIKDTPKKG